MTKISPCFDKIQRRASTPSERRAPDVSGRSGRGPAERTRAFAAALLFLLLAGCGPSAERPNILFIAVDDLNNDLGAYGHDLVQSPHIDRLAAQGIRFDRAYCQYPVCNPSRVSFLTGLYPEQTGVLTNQDTFRVHIPEVATLPQWFRRHGYYVARVGKLFHYNVPLGIGTDGLDDSLSWDHVVNPRGIDREVHDRIHTLIPGQFGGTLSWLSLDDDEGEHTDALGAAAAIALLEERRASHPDQPIFLAVGFYRPHTPYVAPRSYFEPYPLEDIHPAMEEPGDRDDIPVAALADRPKQRELTLEQRREIIQAYYASVSFMDAQVGRLLDALERLDMADNTIVVFASDHGYHLGHHGLWQKGDLFEGSVRVPLIVTLPGSPHAGSATEALAELVDLYPTLVELSGLPAPDHLAGQSLKPILENPAHPGRQAALTVAWSRARWTRPEMPAERILGRTIRTPRFRYTEWNEGQAGVELYDYLEDPQEYANLADRPERAETVRRLKQLLAEKKRAAQ